MTIFFEEQMYFLPREDSSGACPTEGSRVQGLTRWSEVISGVDTGAGSSVHVTISSGECQ